MAYHICLDQVVEPVNAKSFRSGPSDRGIEDDRVYTSQSSRLEASHCSTHGTKVGELDRYDINVRATRLAADDARRFLAFSSGIDFESWLAVVDALKRDLGGALEARDAAAAAAV